MLFLDDLLKKFLKRLLLVERSWQVALPFSIKYRRAVLSGKYLIPETIFACPPAGLLELT